LRVLFLRQDTGGQNKDFRKTVGAESEGMQDRFHIQCHLDKRAFDKISPRAPTSQTVLVAKLSAANGIIVSCISLLIWVWFNSTHPQKLDASMLQ
jgi:hypothetical protein